MTVVRFLWRLIRPATHAESIQGWLDFTPVGGGALVALLALILGLSPLWATVSILGIALAWVILGAFNLFLGIEHLEDKVAHGLSPTLATSTLAIYLADSGCRGRMQFGVQLENCASVPIRFEVIRVALRSAVASPISRSFKNRGGLIAVGKSTVFWAPEMSIEEGKKLPLDAQLTIELVYWNARGHKATRGWRMIRSIDAEISGSQLRPEQIQEVQPRWLFSAETDEPVEHLDSTLQQLATKPLVLDMVASPRSAT